MKKTAIAILLIGSSFTLGFSSDDKKEHKMPHPMGPICVYDSSFYSVGSIIETKAANLECTLLKKDEKEQQNKEENNDKDKKSYKHHNLAVWTKI